MGIKKKSKQDAAKKFYESKDGRGSENGKKAKPNDEGEPDQKDQAADAEDPEVVQEQEIASQGEDQAVQEEEQAMEEDEVEQPAALPKEETSEEMRARLKKIRRTRRDNEQGESIAARLVEVQGERPLTDKEKELWTTMCTRTGPGRGKGLFDVVFETEDVTAREPHRRNYSKNWQKQTRGARQEMGRDTDWWEELLAAETARGALEGKTLRLFKYVWEGQECTDMQIVDMIIKLMEPVGTVHRELAVMSGFFDCGGIGKARSNRNASGPGGGTYIPVWMHDFQGGTIPQTSTMWHKNGTPLAQIPLRNIVTKEGEEADGRQYWDAPAEFITVGMPMIAKGELYTYNLCMQINWQTTETSRIGVDMGLLSGKWEVRELHPNKREEIFCKALELSAPPGVKLVMRPVKRAGSAEGRDRMITAVCGGEVQSAERKMESMRRSLYSGGISMLWQGEVRKVKTSRADTLVMERQAGKVARADSLSQEMKETDPRKMVLSPVNPRYQGPEAEAYLLGLIQQVEVGGKKIGAAAESVTFAPTYEGKKQGTAYVVFISVEMRDAAMPDDYPISVALAETDLKIRGKTITCQPKDPERNYAVARLVADAAGKGKGRGNAFEVRDEEGKLLEQQREKSSGEELRIIEVQKAIEAQMEEMKSTLATTVSVQADMRKMLSEEVGRQVAQLQAQTTQVMVDQAVGAQVAEKLQKVVETAVQQQTGGLAELVRQTQQAAAANEAAAKRIREEDRVAAKRAAEEAIKAAAIIREADRQAEKVERQRAAQEMQVMRASNVQAQVEASANQTSILQMLQQMGGQGLAPVTPAPAIGQAGVVQGSPGNENNTAVLNGGTQPRGVRMPEMPTGGANSAGQREMQWSAAASGGTSQQAPGSLECPEKFS